MLISLIALSVSACAAIVAFTAAWSAREAIEIAAAARHAYELEKAASPPSPPSGQSADLMQWRDDPEGTALASVDSSGIYSGPRFEIAAGSERVRVPEATIYGGDASGLHVEQVEPAYPATLPDAFTGRIGPVSDRELYRDAMISLLAGAQSAGELFIALGLRVNDAEDIDRLSRVLEQAEHRGVIEQPAREKAAWTMTAAGRAVWAASQEQA